jgi:menaquinol-cytochrome c reductase iron-sulfur subunit
MRPPEATPAIHPPPPTGRRGFFKEALAVAIGAALTLVPMTAGLAVFLDPLRRKSAARENFVKVATLDALPGDGVPRKFPVLASRTDAWNKYNNVPIGAVYLRRSDGNQVQALNVVCPHAGCFVDFSAERGNFLCPCHNSAFSMDGTLKPGSPSPRNLDTLKVEIRNENEVWVAFQNFEAGRADKVPLA